MAWSRFFSRDSWVSVIATAATSARRRLSQIAGAWTRRDERLAPESAGLIGINCGRIAHRQDMAKCQNSRVQKYLYEKVDSRPLPQIQVLGRQPGGLRYHPAAGAVR